MTRSSGAAAEPGHHPNHTSVAYLHPENQIKNECEIFLHLVPFLLRRLASISTERVEHVEYEPKKKPAKSQNSSRCHTCRLSVKCSFQNYPDMFAHLWLRWTVTAWVHLMPMCSRRSCEPTWPEWQLSFLKKVSDWQQMVQIFNKCCQISYFIHSLKPLYHK